jgi:hypothetical protein
MHKEQNRTSKNQCHFWQQNLIRHSYDIFFRGGFTLEAFYPVEDKYYFICLLPYHTLRRSMELCQVALQSIIHSSGSCQVLLILGFIISLSVPSFIHRRGTVIVQSNKYSDWLYFVKSGSCSVLLKIKNFDPRGRREDEAAVKSMFLKQTLTFIICNGMN